MVLDTLIEHDFQDNLKMAALETVHTRGRRLLRGCITVLSPFGLHAARWAPLTTVSASSVLFFYLKLSRKCTDLFSGRKGLAQASHYNFTNIYYEIHNTYNM
jgi:hypothetical protein